MSEYEISQGLLGATVKYSCGSCGAPLSSKLSEAGAEDQCPSCGRAFVVPGMAEKVEADLQLKKAEAARRVSQAQKKDAEIAAARLRSLKAQQKAERESIENAERKQAEKEDRRLAGPNNRKQVETYEPGAGDSILDAAFMAARLLSIVVVTVGSALVVILLSIAGWSWASIREAEVTAIQIPTYEEFKVSVAEEKKREAATAPGRGREESSSSEERRPQTIEDVLRKYRVNADYMAANYYLEEVDSSDMADFVTRFDAFLGATAPKDREKAVDWYAQEYFNRSAELQRILDREELRNAMLSARMDSMVYGSILLLGGLVAFLGLPLLIRIERNTRRT